MIVLLVSMPFGALDRPALGISLLQAEAERAGFDCDVRYLTFAFADLVGVVDYGWLVGGIANEALAGEWVFAEALHGAESRQRGGDATYVDEVLRRRHGLTETEIARLLRVRAYVEPFLDHCLTAVPWEELDVVGFTSTFQQNTASLALARRVKAAHPSVTTVFGGANWEGEMGQALHRRYDFVDLACSGEADASFPALLTALERGSSPATVPGIVHRPGGRSAATAVAAPIEDLDDHPMPNFDGYFRDLAASACGVDLTPRLLVETARGCWWGAHAHCTFCGLNGNTMSFRSKSPARVVSEIRWLAERHQITTFSVVDNILDMRYLRTALPALAQGPPLDLFWEVKANLSRQQVQTLAAAGVRRVQPGIESMNDHVLELLRKGTTVLRNVQLLKWAREYGVTVEWNLLYGVPGETADDYLVQARLFRAVGFLDPPGACGPIRLDRFSPYHADPAAFDMRAVRAMAPYQFLYDVAPDEMDRIAYYFDFELARGQDPGVMVAPALEAVERWRAEHALGGGLWALERPDGTLALLDDRADRPRRSAILDGWKAAVYRACDRARSREDIDRLVGEGAAEADVERYLKRCRTTEVMIVEADRWLALAVYAPARDVAGRQRRRVELTVGPAEDTPEQTPAESELSRAR